jgi:UDP-GlcNAc:undecaprenyl-phosphate GlcNAc-1-phosphate transferase
VFGLEGENRIPRLGGIAIYFSFLIPLAGLFFYENNVSSLFLKDARLLTGIFLGGTLVLILGAWDDFKNLSPLTKLILELIIAGLVFGFGFKIENISLPFGDSLSLGVYGFPVTLLWIVGIMNAINLSDGIDGLAAGISFFVVVTLGIVSYRGGNVLNILLCCALGGALLGFFRYNFNPAQIYLGDSGSLFLGYILSILSIWGFQKSTTVIALLTPVVAFGIPILDMLVSIARRYFRGLPIFRRDLEHIHHRLRSMGFSQRKVVLILYAFCIALNAMALLLYVSKNASLVLVVLVLGFIFGLKYLGYLNLRVFRDRWDEFDKMRKERFYRYILSDLVQGLNGQSLEDKAWYLTKNFSEKLDFHFAKLEIIDADPIDGKKRIFEWKADSENRFASYTRVTLPMMVGSKAIGSIELWKVCSDSRPERSIFSGAELLAKEISQLLNS